MWRIPKINYLDRVKHEIIKTKIINKINDNTFFKYCSNGFDFDDIIKKDTDSDEIYNLLVCVDKEINFNALLSKYGPEGLYLIADRLKEIADEDVRCGLEQCNNNK